jgi:cell wall assembly regulator SMI1
MHMLMRAAGASAATFALLLPMSATALDDERPALQAEMSAETDFSTQAAVSASAELGLAGGAGDLVLGRVVSELELETQRGGDVHVNDNNATGNVQDNVARNLTTGNNTITESAFANTAGIPMVIQNSGNNVLIQNSTILNLQLQ